MKRYLLLLGMLFFLVLLSPAQKKRAQLAEGLNQVHDLFNVSMNESVSCYRIPAMVTAPNGDLVAAIDERVPSCNDLRGSDNINIVIRRSSDNGKSWSGIERIVDFPTGKSASDPSMIVDEVTGDIFLFYNFMDLQLEKDVYYLHVVKSADNGKSWSKPEDITAQIAKPEWHNDFKFITSGRGIQTSTGKLLHCLVNVDNGLHLFGSDDHGLSWHFIDTPIIPGDESKVVELNDGSWMINSRYNGKGKRFVHVSTDQGESWHSRAEPTLIDPGCNGSIIRYTSTKNGDKKNRLLFSNAKMKKGRKNMTVRISYDEGETWSEGKTIYPGGSAYSSLTILENGNIGLFFEKDDHNENVFVSFSLSWLTDGKDCLNSAHTDFTTVWQIGESDNSGAEFALAPNDYVRFIENDFGWEDKYFLVGVSDPKTDWPYVIPGTSDSWGGTWGTSGWRSSTLNILFGIKQNPKSAHWKLVVDLLDCNSEDLPLFKVNINGKSWKYHLPVINGHGSIDEKPPGHSEYLIEIPIPSGLIKSGGNEINLTTLEGSWLKFDQVRLEGPGNAQLIKYNKAYLRGVKAASYEIETITGRVQPLLVDIEQLSGTPQLTVGLNGREIFKKTIETGRYIFEVPMPAVSSHQRSDYKILIDGSNIQQGTIARNPHKPITNAGYVDTKIGTAHSRWMIAPGPWMPFGMVKLSPDNQNNGWQAGYEPTFESIGTFSHIHEWTVSGFGTMPTNGPLQTSVGDQKSVDSGYRSRINKETEVAPIGYYSVELTDYDIKAELTATTRCGFQRYTFPKERDGSRVLLDMVIPSEYRYDSKEVYIKKTGESTIEGFSHQVSPNTWSGGVTQEYTIHFIAEFDRPISGFSFWTEEGVQENIDILQATNQKDAGAIVEFDTKVFNVVQLRTGISYVSIENARENLESEISKPYGWDFDAVRYGQLETWAELLNRIKIESNDKREKKRFYNNMYRSICSRNIFSDVNGQWVDALENIQKLEDPGAPALGCDAFWNTFWNLNQFWNLVTPEWSSRWVKSQLSMYDALGWLAKGPAGMEYIPVMVAEHEIPMIVGAYQMGIRDFDSEKAYKAIKKMQTTLPTEIGGGFAGNRDLAVYLKYNYVPYDKGRFSNTLEYAFDDWTVSQLAKTLGKEDDYLKFLKRGSNWKNIIDTETGYARLKDSGGKWMPDFDAYKSGANHHYVEGNAWQLTFFVPQDVPALAEAIGKKRFINRLDWGFRESNKTRFNGLNDQYWDYPVMQGNQQSMHFAFLFNWVDRPWLTQKWSRAILERYYGYGIANAYLGDEDQGQMSAWFIMASIGLFQTDGGCSAEPVYEIGSPLYKKIEINLGNRYGRGETFVIEAKDASRLNKYVQSATLNGKELNGFKFPATELLNGGKLTLEMGPEPNRNWGINAISEIP